MKYIVLLLFTSFLWGGNFVVGKFLVNHASPMTITDLRWIIAILFLFPIVRMKEKRKLPPLQSVLPMFLMALTGVVLFNIFQFVSLQYTTATTDGLLSTLNPVSIAVFSYLLTRDKIRPLQGVALALSFLGVIVFLFNGSITSLLNFRLNSGDLWMLAAVGMWGLYSVFGKWAMRHVSPMTSTLYSGIFGLLLLVPFNISNFTVVNFNVQFLCSLLYTGIISTVVCMVLWNVGVQKLGPTAAGIFLNFNPIFTGILAFLFLGEQLSLTQIISGFVVLIGCYLFSRFGYSSPLHGRSIASRNETDRSHHLG
ncbi:DMT family transporter [Alicyclobacillus fastidiosus]|uniref:DMT family transporter n=1 Tax=Alicyclobacillus fastidiosus TaxID=392011 RepID=A0ABY6ZM77_9BACL|nr:DMT family transporter [Alicyclobacillus fastidiosus]WAH43951.1 DMT family transporter [Alicyclobacillus fastidiosus]